MSDRAVMPESSAGSVALGAVPASQADAEAWDEFLAQHPEGRFCQAWGFRRVLEQTYGYRCVYLKLLRGQQLVGIFPSIIASRPVRRLVSQPFNEYGGPLVGGLLAGEYDQLAQLLFRIAREHGCSTLEIRGGVGLEALSESQCCVRHPLHSFAVLALAEKEHMWRKGITNEARKGVNKARNAGLIAEVRRAEAAVADPFYGLYLISMKRLGVPPHSRRFFEELAAGFGRDLVAAWVMQGSETAAILLGVVTGHRLQIYITASAPQFWSSRPNDLAHWELISWAAQNGLRLFDFGSARYAGQIQFKKKWGVALYDYSYYLVGAPGSPATTRIQSVETDSRLMQGMAKIWSVAVPLRLTSWLGPPIRKQLTK